MSNLFPFILLTGLAWIVIVGLWVVETYDYAFSGFPEEIYSYLLIGIGFVLLAIALAQFNRREVPQNKNDHRVFINKVWKNKRKIADKSVIYILILFIIMAVVDIELALQLYLPALCFGFLITGFFFIMHEDGMDHEWGKVKNRFVILLSKLFDYRKHPFSLSLMLFILIVVTLLLSNQYGIHIDLDDYNMGHPHSISLRMAVYFLPVVIFLCGFLYMIQNSDFLGIRQAKQSTAKLIVIYISDGFVCLLALFHFVVELMAAI